MRDIEVDVAVAQVPNALIASCFESLATAWVAASMKAGTSLTVTADVVLGAGPPHASRLR
jgi:hypothetical protein